MGLPKKERYEMVEITKQELITRGLEVTADHTFWIEELEDYKEYLKGMSGVFRFGHMDEGSYLIGSADDLWLSLCTNIRMYSVGNRRMQNIIRETADVYVAVYLEPNVALRGVYENYLHVLFNPSLKNKNILIEPPVKDVKESSELIVTSADLYYQYKECGVSVEELATQYGEYVARIQYLLGKHMTDEEIEEMM